MAVEISPDAITVALGLVGGITAAKLLGVGDSKLAIGASFLAGSSAAAALSYQAMEKDNINVKMVERGVQFAKEDPLTFGLVVIGMTTVVSLSYQLFLSPEVDGLVALLPIIRLNNIDLVVMLVGATAGILFGAFAGWTIEVMFWVFNGADMTKVPQKPGGRTSWGPESLPKDALLLVLAGPYGVYSQAKTAVDKKSLVPLLFTPVKIAMDYFTRMGDVIIDVVMLGQDVKKLLTASSNAAGAFEDLAEDVIGHLMLEKKAVGDDAPTLYDQLQTAADGNTWLAYPALD